MLADRRLPLPPLTETVGQEQVLDLARFVG